MTATYTGRHRTRPAARAAEKIDVYRLVHEDAGQVVEVAVNPGGHQPPGWAVTDSRSAAFTARMDGMLPIWPEARCRYGRFYTERRREDGQWEVIGYAEDGWLTYRLVGKP